MLPSVVLYNKDNHLLCRWKKKAFSVTKIIYSKEAWSK